MIGNTKSSFGSVAKSFHWLTAGLILVLVPAAIVAGNLPFDTSDQLARKAFFYGLHKTLGLAVFFVALARIVWAITQPRPAPLYPEARAQNLLAEAVHYALYGSLVIMPLTGWIHHAATTGFAPIWWPFGQSLPFVPKDIGVAHTFATLHLLFKFVLIGSLGLHIAGALKHHVVDRDLTLRRMLPGVAHAPDTVAARDEAPGTRLIAPAVAALAFLAAIGAGAAMGQFSADDEALAELERLSVALPDTALDGDNAWEVTEATLGIRVLQLGSEIEGVFDEWSAEIQLDEDAPGTAEQPAGSVLVQIAIPSLLMGQITEQVLAEDFLDAEAHQVASFQGDILRGGDAGGDAGDVEDAWRIDGTLNVRGVSVPLVVPFALTVDGDTASAAGTAQVQRLDFGIGENFADDATVGRAVEIFFTVAGTR